MTQYSFLKLLISCTLDGKYNGIRVNNTRCMWVTNTWQIEHNGFSFVLCRKTIRMQTSATMTLSGARMQEKIYQIFTSTHNLFFSYSLFSTGHLSCFFNGETVSSLYSFKTGHIVFQIYKAKFVKV